MGHGGYTIVTAHFRHIWRVYIRVGQGRRDESSYFNRVLALQLDQVRWYDMSKEGASSCKIDIASDIQVRQHRHELYRHTSKYPSRRRALSSNHLTCHPFHPNRPKCFDPMLKRGIRPILEPHACCRRRNTMNVRGAGRGLEKSPAPGPKGEEINNPKKNAEYLFSSSTRELPTRSS